MVKRDTTYTYKGSVQLSGNSPDKLLIDWGNDTIAILNSVFTQKSDMTIDAKGNLTYPEYNAPYHYGPFSPAWIRNDSISFNIGRGRMFSCGSWMVKGTKVK